MTLVGMKKANTEELTQANIQNFISQHYPRLRMLYKEMFPDIDKIQIQIAKKTFVTIDLLEGE